MYLSKLQMESVDISSNTRTDTEALSDVLVSKAEAELGEKPKWRQRDIEALRDLIQKNKCKFDE